MDTSITDAVSWAQSHIPPWVYIAFIVHLTVLGTVAYMILLERKVASWAQDRIGPNRTGLGFGIIPGLKNFHFWGLGQPLADGLKFFLKEDYRAKNVDKVLFTLAPMIMITTIIISIAVIPWGGIRQTTDTVPLAASGSVQDSLAVGSQIVGTPMLEDQDRDGSPDHVRVTYRYPFQIASLNIGVLYVLATLSLAVYGVVIGGWASNNKYSFLGGLRATANMISYEVPLGLCVLCIVTLYGSLDLGTIVNKQAGYWFGFIPAWNVFTQPIAFVLFLICIHAEANRAPFDLAEAEQELVGGYHTEYSSMRFALFFLAEYAGMITTSCVLVALFFGGWHLPWVDLAFPKIFGGAIDPANREVVDSIVICILRAAIFFAKALGVMFIFMWVRWSLPRFRFDQLMNIAWRGLIPISLALVLGTFLVVYFTGGESYDAVLTPKVAISLLVMNGIVIFGTVLVSTVIPAAPNTNRRLAISGSRFGNAATLQPTENAMPSV